MQTPTFSIYYRNGVGCGDGILRVAAGTRASLYSSKPSLDGRYDRKRDVSHGRGLMIKRALSDSAVVLLQGISTSALLSIITL